MKKAPWMILTTLALGTLLVGLDRTIVNLALPRMLADFHTTVSVIGWVSTVYMLTNSMFIPVFGKLADLYGPRKVYIWGFTAFTVASILTGFSWSIGSMIFFRALQGLFGASVYPTAMALIALHFNDKEARAEALGIWTSILAGSVVIGPLIGGPLIDRFSWPAAFFINLPLGIIAFFLALKFLPKTDHVPVSKPFDYKGAATFGLGLVGILLVLERGTEWGWGSPLTLGIAAFSALMVILFIRFERKDAHPFISFGLLKNKILRSTLVVSMSTYGILYGFLFIFSLYAQNTLGFNATKNGLILLPFFIGISAVSPLGGKMMKRYKAHVPVILGLAFTALGIAGIVAFYHSPGHWFLLIALALIGIGIGLTSAPVSTTATTSVSPADVGFASSLLNLTRNIAGVFFIAVMTILLAANVSYQTLFFVCAIVIALTVFPSFILGGNAKSDGGEVVAEVYPD